MASKAVKRRPCSAEADKTGGKDMDTTLSGPITEPLLGSTPQEEKSKVRSFSWEVRVVDQVLVHVFWTSTFLYLFVDIWAYYTVRFLGWDETGVSSLGTSSSNFCCSICNKHRYFSWNLNPRWARCYIVFLCISNNLLLQCYLINSSSLANYLLAITWVLLIILFLQASTCLTFFFP